MGGEDLVRAAGLRPHQDIQPVPGITQLPGEVSGELALADTAVTDHNLRQPAGSAALPELDFGVTVLEGRGPLRHRPNPHRPHHLAGHP
ncbi:hypothetical protein [Streptomyces carpaticus]|uniref:hypothetical protein n=1 Tax=Streptomyces carpaticus TaxID=285558 RepID=UPI0031F8A097